jgi:phosphatidylglycerophosphatase A
MRIIPDFLAKPVITFFYFGYCPVAPGTAGSLAGLGLYFLVKDSPQFYLLAFALVTVAGVLLSGEGERIFGRKDPNCVVIDEVSGMLLSLALLPYDVRVVGAGFILFRVFDALKPFPADKLQSLKGSAGIMSDDIMAALYTNVLLQIVVRLNVISGV